jgi:hypothetical protein
MNDPLFISEILHPLLGKGCPDDVPRQVLHRFLFFRLDTVPAEDMKSGMPPCVSENTHRQLDKPLFLSDDKSLATVIR